MTKGFLTLATGDEHYFELAVNLLNSYKVFSKDPLPFAILTDRHNKFTAQFDDVILLKDAKSSYMDKLSILINCPYDENIFIDADCLAYQDLNQYWDLYDFSSTLSCFGTSNSLDFQDGWFKKEDVGIYKNIIQYIPNMHGGCYFIRNTPQCEEVYNLALEINSTYKNFKFKYFSEPADEPILALCMAIFNFHPIQENTGREIVFYPTVKNLKADIARGENKCIKRGKYIENSFLIHWQNHFTKKAIYKIEVDKLKILYKKELIIGLKATQDVNFTVLEILYINYKKVYHNSCDLLLNLKVSIKIKIYRLIFSNKNV